jgi:type 1 glutamine amidotransferase
MTSRPFWSCLALVAAIVGGLSPIGAQERSRPARKHVLAWGDVHAGYQHDSISHAFATIERLGRDSGVYDTWFRTDSQTITKHAVLFPEGTGIAQNPRMVGNESFLVRNLNFFDAIFFFGVREVGLTSGQKADLLSFVKEDGKEFVGVHSAITAFFSWPEFGEMIGGRFDEHPWDVADATVVVEDPAFPAMKGFPSPVVMNDEHYQLKDWSRSKVRVLAHLDPRRLDLSARLVHRTDGDFPVAWARMYGNGRVFYSTLGHADTAWDNPSLRQMYFNALRWTLRLVDGDATPRPRASR